MFKEVYPSNLLNDAYFSEELATKSSALKSSFQLSYTHFPQIGRAPPNKCGGALSSHFNLVYNAYFIISISVNVLGTSAVTVFFVFVAFGVAGGVG